MRRPSALGLLIRHQREKMHLSRGALAQRARLSESTIKNIETGMHEATRVSLESLATALGLPELAGPRTAVAGLLTASGPAPLAELLRHYSPETLAEALRQARADLWALFRSLFPASASAAETMAGIDVTAMTAEQRGPTS